RKNDTVAGPCLPPSKVRDTSLPGRLLAFTWYIGHLPSGDRLCRGWLGGLDDRGVQPWLGLVGRRDANGGEPGGLENLSVLTLGESAVAAADPLFGLGALHGIEAFVDDDIADAQTAARAQHAERLGEGAGLVGGQVDHTVGDDDVDGGVRQRDVLDMAVQE